MPDITTMAKILGGGLPGGAVAGRSEIINMIEPTGDPQWDRERRIAHNGTFNANPLSAVAGIAALELVRDEAINEKATAAGNKLKEGLNSILSKLEIPGCASGVNSLIHLKLGSDHDCNGEICILSHEEVQKTTNSIRDEQLNLALLNHGVHSGTRFILSATHTEEDIKYTINAFESALLELREQGSLQ